MADSHDHNAPSSGVPATEPASVTSERKIPGVPGHLQSAVAQLIVDQPADDALVQEASAKSAQVRATETRATET